MSEFNEYNWKIALTNLYQKSVQDSEFRALCLTDPLAAIKQVSDIELPAGIKLQFFGTREEYVYTFLLPPVPDPQNQGADSTQEIIKWATLCTDITTTHTEPLR